MSKLWKEFAERGLYFIKAASVVYLIREHVVEVTVCVGPSMMPTFNHRGDVALLEHISVQFNTIKKGDIVVARSVQNPRHSVCKRVLGLEGDQIRVGYHYGGKVVTVPPGHVWLQGDNTHNSTDSRHYGPVPYALLKGRVFMKIWPPWEATWMDRTSPNPPF